MMRLSYSVTSPYVRKVLVVALEAGVADRIEKVATDPWSKDTDLPASNPLNKVPTLMTEEGEALFDSPVICEYLDSLSKGAGPLLPPPGPARWQALRQQALADGICDAAILRRLDSQRPTEQQSEGWQNRQRDAVTRACDLLESEAAAGALGAAPTIGTLAVACALGYLDFRWSHEDWRQGRAALTRWNNAFAKRPSIADTAPPQ